MGAEITVAVTIQGTMEKIWKYWTSPVHIVNWNFASEDWTCPRAENTLKVGSQFSWRMEAKDGSAGFDFCGTYQHIQPHARIEACLADGRVVLITFTQQGPAVRSTGNI